MQSVALSKSELAECYGVTLKTLRSWVELACEKIEAFTFEQYKKMRILPPKWVAALRTHLGSVLVFWWCSI